ncbi:chemotaxis protein CheA [Fundidesulfovibrio putealis]|uniref:chemotaxis protein CheA n=1 Tax=Fundidesulfovibrio putealis TaxID=270496 RepID=UPI00040EE509|nr:chemotaxis protein CheA [Fundidesulfovibrio putealis]
MEDIHRQAFRDEAADLLVELESALLELEDSPGDMELVNRVFRAMHTLKGSGAMFGFDDIAQFTHEVETVFDQVRSGHLQVTKVLLDLTFQAKDHVKVLLEHDGTDLGDYVDAAETVLNGFRVLAAQSAPGDDSAMQPGVCDLPLENGEAGDGSVHRVRVRPKTGIYATGNNPEYLIEDLRSLGQTMVFAHIEDIPPLRELDPQNCHIWWDVLLTSDATENAIRDVFIFVEDECDFSISTVETSGDVELKKLGEILIERGDITAEGINRALSGQKRLGAILTEAGMLPERSVEAALAEQSLVKQKQEQKKGPEGTSSLRVSAEKLDLLQDLVGELVIVQAQIKQVAPSLGNSMIVTLAEQLERLSDDIRDSTLAIRMLPIGSTFSTYRRLVRDLSAEIGKEIDLVTSGEDTELDKTVLDRLGDALIHLLRNSIDHGIETPDQREAAGKPRRGTLQLGAEHSGGDVVIQIVDDGKGIDPEKVRQKAVERGLISDNAELTLRETLELIFLPGFSTAQTVSSVSGRGVGMDVVKRVVNAMRGSIDIDTELHKGSVVTIRLPLTLAIIDGLQVCVGTESYVLPLDVVEECVQLDRKDLGAEGRRRMINLRGEVVPIISLREWFRLPGELPSIEQVVILNVDGNRMGMVVDHVVGEHQTVIKSLGPVFRRLEGFSGATIQGDGTMSLILDVKRIVRLSLGEVR